MKLVLDASVALKWFFQNRPDEQDADAAAAILNAYSAGHHELLAPAHFQAEICAVLARESPQSMADALRDLLELAIPIRDDAAVYLRAMQLSRDLDHHLFDTLYHAIALESKDAVLITADARYLAKASGSGQILGLAQWTSSA